MKILLKYVLIVTILFIGPVSILEAQGIKVERQVMSNGAMLKQTNNNNYVLNGSTGQIITGKITKSVSGQRTDNYQGFWLPILQKATDVNDPTQIIDENLKNFPNPFTSSTVINYTLPVTAYVTIKIYDVTGKVRRVILNELQQSGEQNINFDGKDESGTELSSGSYLYELEVRPAQMAGNPGISAYQLRNRMIVLK
ncbi:MAG: Por secretion system C-terminal sorting protein [Ignavibacteria bacterium]|nr:Por secretion system C-terminal sorting protein [Ignavibacteria bacterium]